MAEGTWAEITDFKPGIHQNVSPNHPPGVAQDEGTYSCYANSSGSLIPLPANTATVTHDLLTGGAIESEEFRITGLFVNDPVFYEPESYTGIYQNNSEVWVGFEWSDATDLHQQVERYLRDYAINPDWELVHTRAYTNTYDSRVRPRKTEFIAIRSNTADPNVAGPVVVCWVCSGVAQSFPDDTAPTVSGTRYMPGDNVDDASAALLGVDGIVAHQGRAVIFPLSVLGMGTNQVYVTNEAFYWTPVNDVSQVDTSIAVGGYFNGVAAYDNPTGYQVYESQTANELLLIKARGGGMIISGNLNDYQVRNLPNVRGTGHSMNRGTRSPRGFVYPTDNGGVWLWEGGDLSVNISPQMDPNFWRTPAVSPALGDDPEREQSENEWGYQQTQCCEWNQFVMFPNNWLWDTDHNGWWKIANGDEFIIHRWAADWANLICYGTPSGFVTADDPVLYEFNKVVPASEMGWHSHPLEGTIDRRVIMREFILTAEGDGEVVITITNADGDSQSETVVIHPNETPQIRSVMFGQSGSHLTIKMVSTATTPGDPAPTIHGLKYQLLDTTMHNRDLT
jgi:hypothetical protein